MSTIEKTYHITASPEEVWEALTNAHMIERWSGAKAEMKPEEGFVFRLWDGDIWGTNLRVRPNKLLTQQWYSSDMGRAQATEVTFKIGRNEDRTTLELSHKGVPDKNHDAIEDGWDDYYLGPIKKLLEKS